MNNLDMSQEMKTMVSGTNEYIQWTGRPSKACFYLESIFNPLLPFALLWFFFDAFIIGGFVLTAGGVMGGESLFMLGFFAIHLMPVWIYLFGVLFTALRYKNIEYVITDRAVYISGGTFSRSFETKSFQEMSHVTIHRGIFDQWLNVGDVKLICGHSMEHSHGGGMQIINIPDYLEVYELLKKLQTDIYSDTMYPNALRPEENPGYQTRYTGLDQKNL